MKIGLVINMSFKGIQSQSPQLHSHQMEGTLCQALGITQSEFGMHRQVPRWATLWKGTLPHSGQLHSHQMEGTLCQALGITQSEFGMHRQVPRWATLWKGTLPQSPQLHSHQMEGTLYQAQRIMQSNFGMPRLNHVLLRHATLPQCRFNPIQLHFHSFTCQLLCYLLCPMLVIN